MFVLEARLVALARVFVGIVTQAVMARLAVRVRAQLTNIDIDTKTRHGRQIDPTLFDREALGCDVDKRPQS